ncbi:MAG: endonuclease/exonuclease/phosphatase family protein, partial [Flavobacteriales bacterium]|nr:endonuclease/exonuclease/phosphatase family protein [Flavobacteriales bacterium]
MKMFRFRLIALYIYLLASVATCMAQATIPAASAIRIAFYNTENLFHPDNDSLTLDDEFTPDGKLHWTYNRYRIKLQHISKVLMAMGGWNGLAIAGMCELENRQVLEDLLKYTPLSNGNWGIVHHDSPDHRGIDVGLIYNRQCFTVISDRACLVRPPGSQLHTRDILYVKGVLNGSDTLHIMVNHWPSRRGGAETSEPKRVYAGQVLKFLADSILQKQPSAMILAMGDFNDGPGNASIRQLIDTGVTFRHTMLPQDPFSGSHKFAGD